MSGEILIEIAGDCFTAGITEAVGPSDLIRAAHLLLFTALQRVEGIAKPWPPEFRAEVDVVRAAERSLADLTRPEEMNAPAAHGFTTVGRR